MYEYQQGGGFGGSPRFREFEDSLDSLFGGTDDDWDTKMAAMQREGASPAQMAAVQAAAGQARGGAGGGGGPDILGAILNPVGAIMHAVTGGGAPGGGGAGGLLGGLPIVGPLLSGITGGGGLGGLLPGLGQGVTQAMGQAPASSPLGSLLGAGMGGLPFGTGPLPDPLGLFAQRQFGTSALPPASVVDSQSVLAGPWRDLATHTERIGRAVVSRVMGITGPQLQEVRDWLRQRGAQLQATGEHRNILADADFKTAVIQHLLGISSYLGLPSPAGALGVSSAANLPALSTPASIARVASQLRKRY